MVRLLLLFLFFSIPSSWESLVEERRSATGMFKKFTESEVGQHASQSACCFSFAVTPWLSQLAFSAEKAGAQVFGRVPHGDLHAALHTRASCADQGQRQAEIVRPAENQAGHRRPISSLGAVRHSRAHLALCILLAHAALMFFPVTALLVHGTLCRFHPNLTCVRVQAPYMEQIMPKKAEIQVQAHAHTPIAPAPSRGIYASRQLRAPNFPVHDSWGPRSPWAGGQSGIAAELTLHNNMPGGQVRRQNQRCLH